MADDGVTKEATRQTPLDVMVATFADRQAARDAYKTLKTMDKEGAIALDGAIVIDRNEMGKVHLEGAMLPRWLWGVIVGFGAIMAGMIGLVVWFTLMAVRGMRANMRQEGGGTSGEPYGDTGYREREGMRMSTE